MCCAAGGSAYGLIQLVAEGLIRRDTAQSASEWSNYVSENVPDLADILQGDPPSPDSVVFLEQSRKVGRVFRFSLYDKNLNLKARSDELGKMQTYASNLNSDEPAIAQALGAEGSLIVDNQGAGKNHPLHYSRAIVPFAGAGGWLEIFFDQTERQQAIFDWASKAGIAGALLLGAIPALLLRRRQNIAAKRQQEEDNLRRLALTDSLTGLANRNAFFAALGDHMSTGRGQPGAEKIAIHIIDLDDFKNVNDTLGHDTGDRFLATVAKNIKDAVGANGIAARIGGDEFAVIQRAVNSDADALALGEHILDAMRETIHIRTHHIIVKCSIGSAVGMPGEIDGEALAKRADVALYAAKSSGKSVVKLFDSAIEARFDRQRLLAIELSKACETMAFDIHYQPVFQLDDGRLIGFEALLRMPKANGGFESPTDFIPVAEETGKIEKIGAWVLRESCNVAAEWDDELTIAVNLSPVQFRAGKIVSQVSEALAASGLPPHRLELEITEGLLLRDSEHVLSQLQALRDLGVRLAIDDFGTGYSSLSYLCKFKVDKIKIDRSFLLSVEDDKNAMNVLETIVELGRKLNIPITAEGVETIEQAAMLSGMQCDLVQGFLYGRPTPLAGVASVVLRNFERLRSGQRLLSAEPGGALIDDLAVKDDAA
jgi:diguanylate cyclase (GGDEF)-like protein